MWAFIQNRRIKRIVALKGRQERDTALCSTRNDLELALSGEGYSRVKGTRNANSL
jgi:hypothetical protein